MKKNKKTISLILSGILCLLLCACGFNQKLYDTHLSGKWFENDGRIISFDEDNCMTYNFTNLRGDTYRYTYSVIEIRQEDDDIIMSIKLESANDYSEIIDKDEIEEVIYHVSENNLEYYSLQYEYVG